MSMKRVAEAISLLLGFPWIVIIVGLLLDQNFLLSFLYVVFLLLIPLGYVGFLLVRHKVSDFDITRREERFKPMLATMCSFTTAIALAWFFGTTRMFHLSMILYAVFLANFIITFFWKISLHMTLNVIGVILLNVIFHWTVPYLFLVIPLIFWSRLYLERHTVAQLLAGLFVSGGIMMVGLSVFGFV